SPPASRLWTTSTNRGWGHPRYRLQNEPNPVSLQVEFVHSTGLVSEQVAVPVSREVENIEPAVFVVDCERGPLQVLVEQQKQGLHNSVDDAAGRLRVRCPTA